MARIKQGRIVVQFPGAPYVIYDLDSKHPRFELSDKAKKITNPTLVVPMDIRHMVFVILAEFVRNITVLAHEELVSDYNIKFVGKI